MAFRRPAAHLRRPQSWTTSGDESYGESSTAEGEVLPCVSCPPRAPRPQSAIEGGQVECWLEHLQRMQRDFFRTPDHDQVSVFSDRTASMHNPHRQSSGHDWTQPGFTSIGGSSSCGSTTLCGSTFGSQESLQSGFFSPPERRGSWERAHIMQAPSKEQTELSSLAPVKIGWLPIQRRVMVAEACNKGQPLHQSAGQVKLKQSITPTIQNNRLTANRQPDEKVESPRTSLTDMGVKTGQKPLQGSPVKNQVPEKQGFLSNKGGRLVGWQALRRSWNTIRGSTSPVCSQSSELSTGSISEPNRKSPLLKAATTEPLQHPPHPGANSTETWKSYAPRPGSVQPIRATVPLCRTNSSSQPSNAVTTSIPQSKTGFSSITISSRKVIRSSSLPGSDTPNRLSHSSESISPPRSMDKDSRKVTVQRKATIVKVTEQSMMTRPGSSTDKPKPANDAWDAVVHRRKATIIKVTEHRESYIPAKAGSGARRPEYRQSYTDGAFKDNRTMSQGNHSQQNATPSYHHQDSSNSAVPPNQSDAEGHSRILHRSTLSLVVSTPTTTAAPAPSEVPLRAAGRRRDRPQSCNGNVFGHTEASMESARQPAARKWSFELPQESGIHSVNSGSGFISSPTAVSKAGQQVADSLEPNRGNKERSPPENAERRVSPCLTLIKAPDPGSNQSAEDVLALNAAAIIANIKLQRQLSKKKGPNGKSEKDSSASPQGKSVTDEEKCKTPHPDQKLMPCHNQPHAAFVPLDVDPAGSPQTFSLQEALQRSRPDFISRSQCRVRELERRRQERRERADLGDPRSEAALRPKRVHSARPTALNDNLFKPRDKAVNGKEMQQRSKRALPREVKRKKEQEKKKEACLSNRQQVELFKKKLLDQILRRSNS